MSFIYRYSPIGIFFLVAAEVVNMDNPVEEIKSLALYMATVIAGLAIHSLIILPLIYLIIVRKNPYKFLAGVAQALITALATASRYVENNIIHIMDGKESNIHRVSCFIASLIFVDIFMIMHRAAMNIEAKRTNDL